MVKIKVNFPKKFKQMCFKIGMTESDLDDLENEVLEFENRRENNDEVLGDLMPRTGGGIKYRFSSSASNKGKSGSERVIYCTLNLSEGIKEYNFLLCYPKGAKENLTRAEEKKLKQLIQLLKNSRQTK